MQRINRDRAELLSPAARFAAEAEAIAARLEQIPTFPALEAARAKFRECEDARAAAEAELNAKGRVVPAADGTMIPDKATKKLQETLERAVAAKQAAGAAVQRERERAQQTLQEHRRQFGAEVGEILEGCGLAVERLGKALMKVADGMSRHGTAPHAFLRAATLLGISQSLRSR